MPIQITFHGLPIAPGLSPADTIQDLLAIAALTLAIMSFRARNNAVSVARQIKGEDSRWLGDSRFNFPRVSFVDPAINLLWGKIVDLPEPLQAAIPKWRRLTNRTFVVTLALAAVMIWRNEAGF
ncbi:hypothetical protein [Rhizorhabdus sp. FW153]|uniref:hypothetical protein n=1 Tax=Rhizorhabdus sp. FW153 TaxID=3400216 RepID=UPI003CEE8BB2